MSFWDFFQTMQIRDTTRKADNAAIKSRRNENDIKYLEEKIDALSLVTHAMWELLQENTNVSLKQLESKIEEIDLRDGKLDGKLSTEPTHCPDCGHKINKRHTNCFWCGTLIQKSVL